MVRIEIKDDRIKVTGHAEYGPDGNDLVCASVSTMVNALEIGTQRNFVEVVTKEEGEAEFKLYEPANPGMKLMVMAVVNTFVSTCQHLAESFPQHVELIIEEVQ